MKEHFNKTTDTRATAKIQRIHADISGIKTESYRGYRYFMLFVDDHSRMTWVYFTKTKTAQECALVFKQFKTMVELETENKIQFVRGDNGKGEFSPAFQDELKNAGIQFEVSPPYKHSMNGVVERAMQAVNKMVRSMMFEAKLPVEMWDYTVEHRVFVKIRIPTAALPHDPHNEGSNKGPMTPYEAYARKKLDLSNLRVFELAAFPVSSKEKHPTSCEPRALQDWILIGMKGNSIYRALNIKTLEDNFFAFTMPMHNLLAKYRMY